MIPYQILIQDAEGYLSIIDRNIRPLDPSLDGELMREREIVLPDDTPIKYCKWQDSALVPMTAEERTARDEYDVAQAAAAEAARQAAKPFELKQTENNFFALCYALFGDNQKRGFSELNAAIETLKETDFQAASELAMRLLAVDAEAKREGGLSWWDDAVLHEDIL